MSSPFKKVPELDASDVIERRKQRALIKSFNTKPANYNTKSISVKDKKIVSYISKDAYLNYSKGYFENTCKCYDTDPNHETENEKVVYTKTLSQGAESIVDLQDDINSEESMKEKRLCNKLETTGIRLEKDVRQPFSLPSHVTQE